MNENIMSIGLCGSGFLAGTSAAAPAQQLCIFEYKTILSTMFNRTDLVSPIKDYF